MLTALADEKKFFALKVELAKHNPPAIYSGTGAQIATSVSAEELVKALDKSMGFRFMGQRFIPDSYMMGKLVFPTVGRADARPHVYAGGDAGRPDSRLPARPRRDDASRQRSRPRPAHRTGRRRLHRRRQDRVQLRRRADEAEEGVRRSDGRGLEPQPLLVVAVRLEAAVGGLRQGLSVVHGDDGVPHEVAEHRPRLVGPAAARHHPVRQAVVHDHLGESASPPEKPVQGYVEPLPEFYARLLALSRMTSKGLGEMNVLNDAAKQRLASFESILERLLAIVEKELADKALTDQDYQYIKDFGEQLERVVVPPTPKGENQAMKTTLAADVHTDQNSKEVLEEATGYVDLGVFVYRQPDGRLVIGAGPVLSYYEFKHPMKDRLTDEKWRELLKRRQEAEPAGMDQGVSVHEGDVHVSAAEGSNRFAARCSSLSTTDSDPGGAKPFASLVSVEAACNNRLRGRDVPARLPIEHLGVRRPDEGRDRGRLGK